MKNLFKKAAAAGLLATAMTGMASAQTVIHVAGSTAFRAPVICAIINYLGGGGTCRAAYNGTGGLFKGTTDIFANGTIGSGGTATVIVETNWTGSVAGVVDLVTQNTALNFCNESDTTATTGVQAIMNGSGALTTGSVGSTAYGGGAELDSGAALTGSFLTTHAPDFVMSDSFYTSVAAEVSSANLSGQPGTITVSPVSGKGLASLITANAGGITEAGSATPIVTGAQGYLGIVPFQWILGNIGSGTTIPFTNITQQAASFLIQGGAAPLTMFSTLKADGTTANSSADFVYLIGRNEDSGTRVDAFAEPQLGFAIDPNQFLLTFTGGTISQTSAIPAPAANNGLNTGGSATTVTDLTPWTQGTPLNTESKLSWANNTGHGGYVSGGDVATVLSTPVDQTDVTTDAQGNFPENTGNVYFMGYISIADAGGYVAPGTTTNTNTNAKKVTNGTCLTFNGVPYSPTAVNNGSYSFWSYEHMYYLTKGTGAIGSTAKNAVDSIANSVASTFVDYDGNGVSGSTVTPDDGAGIKLSTNPTSGNVYRSIEGGAYNLNY